MRLQDINAAVITIENFKVMYLCRNQNKDIK